MLCYNASVYVCLPVMVSVGDLMQSIVVMFPIFDPPTQTPQMYCEFQNMELRRQLQRNIEIQHNYRPIAASPSPALSRRTPLSPFNLNNTSSSAQSSSPHLHVPGTPYNNNNSSSNGHHDSSSSSSSHSSTKLSKDHVLQENDSCVKKKREPLKEREPNIQMRVSPMEMKKLVQQKRNRLHRL